MDLITQLVSCARATAGDINAFVQSCQAQFSNTNGEPIKLPQDASAELRQTKQSLLANIVKLQRLIMGPSDLLQQLACQAQLLACLQWLAYFQVLACIPLGDSVPFKDISDLAGVPETQLRRVLRMTATFGFLCEPEPGLISHSALSAAFVTDPSLLDAVVFMANTALPAALQMPACTQRFDDSSRSSETAYNVSSNSDDPFNIACQYKPQLRRQLSAFWRHGTGDVDDGVAELLQSLKCSNQLHQDPGTIVEIGATSTTQAVAIATNYPLLQVIVQMEHIKPIASQQQQPPWLTLPSPDSMQSDPSILDGQVTIQQRTLGTSQPVHDAIVYILHLTSFTFDAGSLAPCSIQTELKQLLGILKNNTAATLVITSGLLPELGTVSPKVEARARLRDLTLFQLTNQNEVEMIDMMRILKGVKDDTGHLVLINKHCSSVSGDLALELKYQAFAKST